jgi:hypothetical protein
VAGPEREKNLREVGEQAAKKLVGVIDVTKTNLGKVHE